MKNYAGANILITGGLGFIGSHLAKKLVGEGAKVTIADSLMPQYGGNLFNIDSIKDDVNIKITDIRNRGEIDLLLKDKHFLFNLAGQTSHLDSMLDPRTDLEINAAAQLSILESCRFINSGIKVVFASTRQIYGKPQYLPVDELHPISPVDVNGINKLAGEWYHLLYNNVYGVRACALRLTNTYGPGMRIKDARQTFLGIWFKRLLEGDEIDIFGDGLQLRDFNFVGDCINALLLAGLSDDANGKVYNLGSDEVINLIGVAEKMTSMGYGGKFKLTAFPPDRKVIDIGDYYGDYSLIKRDLNWSPKVSLDEGLRLTAAFYQQYMKHYI
jgi:UDP-glucose 4-epimerase